MPTRPTSVDLERIAELAGEQQQVLSRAQLARHGARRGYVAHRVASGRWQALGGRVVVLTSGELTDRQRRWVAVLHAGTDSALAGVTAAGLGGLRGFESRTLHVVVPHGADASALVVPDAGLRVAVRQSRRLVDGLVQPARSPRRLRLVEAVVDAASEAVPPDRSRLLVIAAVQQRLLRPEDLRRAVAGRARLPRRALIIEAIADVEGGAHSLPERDWTRAIRRHRLPEPTGQQRVQRPDGRWYLDADFWPWGVGVEINGAQHLLVTTAAAEDHRRNVLGTGGRLMITIGSHVVRHQPGVAVVATAAALLSRGWSPEPTVRRGLQQLADDERMDLVTGDWLPGRVRVT